MINCSLNEKFIEELKMYVYKFKAFPHINSYNNYS